MKRKKALLLLAAALLATVLLGCGTTRQSGGNDVQSPSNSETAQPDPGEKAPATAEGANWPKLMSLGTASTGGAYYNVGVAIGKTLESHLPTSVTVEVTAGALENPVLISNGELEMGFTNEHIAYAACNGTAQFENNAINVECLAAGLQPGVVHFAVLDGSDITALSDLKGKVIAVGTQGNG